MIKHKNLPSQVTPIMHKKYGNMLQPDTVVVSIENDSKISLPDYYSVIHVGVTGRCNANCVGCINTNITTTERIEVSNKFEMNPQRDAQIVNELIATWKNEEIIVALYGGEPLLELSKCIEFLNNISNNDNKKIKIMLYTNGMLIDEVIHNYPNFFSKIWLVSVSIDGQKEQHNKIRKGTDLQKIVDNLKMLKNKYNCKVIMWSTLREEQSLRDCFIEFKKLYRENLVDYFFYHFAESKDPYKDIKNYAKKYEKDFRIILMDYINSLNHGEIMPIIHLNELLSFILLGYKRGHTSCGVELLKNFDIVGGEIYPCADLSDEFKIGDLSNLNEIKNSRLNYLTEYKKLLECNICGIEFYCGGRCPVQALMGSYVRTKEICQLLRLHVAMVMEQIDEIKKAMEKNNITPMMLYLNSGYLSKLTDVIP